eukprot:COSAG06_NODE_57565_length_280_cov_0.569061_1_plen_28_part_10
MARELRDGEPSGSFDTAADHMVTDVSLV